MNEKERYLTLAALLTVPVAAFLLDRSIQTIIRWIEAEKLEAVDMSLPGAKNNTYLVKTESVRRLLECEK